MLKFSRSLYFGNHSSESIHIWTMVPSRVSFHSMTSDSRVHAGGGARGQNLVHLQKLGFLCLSFLEVYIGGSPSRKILRFNTIVFRKDKWVIIVKVIIRTLKIRVLWGLKVVPIGRNKGR